MKVFIAASWLKLGGGVTRTLLELLKRIDYSEHDVTLMVMSLDRELLSFVPEQVKVIETEDSFQTESMQSYIKRQLKGKKLFTAASCTVNLLDYRISGDNYRHQAWITSHMEKQDGEYDVAIAYAMMNSIVNKYIIDNVRAKKKILWCHTDMSIYKEKYLKGLCRLYSEYDQINCVSQTSLKSVKNRFPELSSKLKVAYNFIDIDRIKLMSEAPVDVDVPESKIKLCTISRISKEKGTDILVDAAKVIKSRGLDFIWWVIGPEFDKEYCNSVKAMISEYGLEDRVLLLGEKNPPYPYVKNCDIYVQPSRFEGYCTTTNEAKILCKPIITTLVSGAEEQFTDGVNGTVTEISADAIADAITELAQNEQKREMYIKNLQTGAIAQETSFESMIL